MAEPQDSPTLTAEEGYAAWNQGAGIDGVLERCHPDVEWSSPFPEATTARGHAAVREWFARVHEAWEDLEFVPQRYEARGDEIVVWLRVRGISRLGGVPVEMPLVQTWTVRDGKAAAMRLSVNSEEFGGGR